VRDPVREKLGTSAGALCVGSPDVRPQISPTLFTGARKHSVLQDMWHWTIRVRTEQHLETALLNNLGITLQIVKAQRARARLQLQPHFGSRPAYFLQVVGKLPPLFANVGRQPEPERQDLAAVSVNDWRRELRKLFAADPSFIMGLIDASPEIGATPIHALPTLPTWHRGRVGLLGDAAHAVSPSAGQGASMAIEDAIVLARCLRDIAPPEEAFARYEALRRPRAEKIVATGRKRGTYKALNNRAAIWLRDQIMPLVFRHFATDEKMSWIHDHVIPWDEPVVHSGRSDH
jgi:2-polyprenyl-6-methoxyphenol hydroxylase-like FAD-dependent oxidoreductase